MNMPFDPLKADAAKSMLPIKVQAYAADDAGARAQYTQYLDKRDLDARAHADNVRTTPFHSLSWLDAVNKGTGHKSWLLIASNKQTICGILPCHMISSLLFGKAMVSTGFAVDGGILADDQQAANMLAEAFWKLATDNGCPTAELRGGMLPSGADWHIKTDSHLGFVTDLASDDEAQLKAVPRKQRAEIRKGLKNNLDVRIGNGIEDQDWHYRVYSESVRNLGTPVFPKKLFQQTLLAFGDDADILTILHEGVPVASVLSLYHNGHVMPYWGGGVFAARQLRANDVMYYALMNHARLRGCNAFDFGRSKTDTGAAHFKKNWGFEGAPLAYALRTANGAAPRDINPLSPKYQAKIKLWQKLPLPLANMIGPFIARGLG